MIHCYWETYIPEKKAYCRMWYPGPCGPECKNFRPKWRYGWDGLTKRLNHLGIKKAEAKAEEKKNAGVVE